MKKIFFIINSYSGGSGTVLSTIINHLDPAKYMVGVMEIIHSNEKMEFINKNVKIYPYYVKADDPQRKSKMYYVYHQWDKIIHEYIPQDYDLYISFNYLRPTFLLPPEKKTIAWIHGDVYDLAQKNKEEERELQDTAFEKVRRIVSISDITTQSLIDLFPNHREKICVIYNGVDIKDIREKAKEETTVSLQHPAILSIGRLDANKNPLRMLDIFEKVYSKNKQAHLYYLGTGILEDEVRRIGKDKGIDEHIHLLGYYKNPFPIIAQCDVSALFSLSEGFPMALLESVALDKPFVSSIVGGTRILANGQKCGRIVETDEEGVAAILTFLQADSRSLINECRKSIQRFKIETYISQIEELFDEILNEEEK